MLATDALVAVGLRKLRQDDIGEMPNWGITGSGRLGQKEKPLKTHHRRLKLKQTKWNWWKWSQCFDATTPWVIELHRCNWMVWWGEKYWQYAIRETARTRAGKNRKRDLTIFNTIGKCPCHANGQIEDKCKMGRPGRGKWFCCFGSVETFPTTSLCTLGREKCARMSDYLVQL